MDQGWWWSSKGYDEHLLLGGRLWPRRNVQVVGNYTFEVGHAQLGGLHSWLMDQTKANLQIKSSTSLGSVTSHSLNHNCTLGNVFCSSTSSQS
jgi:hypothetical protein